MSLSTSGVPATCRSHFVVAPIEGTYYKAGSPERTNITGDGIAGNPLTLTGYVLDKDCLLSPEHGDAPILSMSNWEKARALVM